MTRIDEIDYTTIRKGLPSFVYFGEDYIGDMAQVIRDSGINNYEVIGGNMASVAQEFESRSQRDLNLMLKFGRKITNYDAFEGVILDVDTVELPFPYESLSIVDIQYHEAMDLITATYRNDGNIEAYVFSNIDYADVVLSDDDAHPVLPGETKTIAYPLDGLELSGLDEPAVITTRYGFDFPLQKVIEGPTGLPFIEYNVTRSSINELPPTLNFRSAIFNADQGFLELRYVNADTKPVQLFTEMYFEDCILTSPLQTIAPGDSAKVIVDFSYVQPTRVIDLVFNLTTHYGFSDTYFTESYEILVKEPTNYIIYIVIAGSLVVLALLWVLIKKYRQRRNDQLQKNL